MILQNATGGDTWIATGNGTAAHWPGGSGTLSAVGTWNGSTMTTEVSFDGGTTWTAIGAATTLTADGHANFELPPCQLRAVFSVAAPTSVVVRVGNHPRG